MKICIVTPEYATLFKNGGIGTACHYLAELLAQENEVHVLYTGETNGNTKAPIKASSNLTLHFLDLNTFPYSKKNAAREIKISICVYEFLKTRSFDLIHFQDYQGQGFISIQAKRTGLAFHNTILALTMHSSSEWLREVSLELSKSPLKDYRQDYYERYCHSHCDVLISPSQYLLDWARQKSWTLCRHQIVLKNALISNYTSRKVSKPDLQHLIFFGRLETRKGLEIFCQSIDALIGLHPIRRITFLGRPNTVHGIPAKDYLKSFISRWEKKGLTTHLITDFSHTQANEYIRDKGGIVIIPSLADNFPYTVLESVDSKFYFLASNTGGIPEIADANWLFDPTVEGLTRAIQEIPQRFREDFIPKHPYNASEASHRVIEFHRHLSQNFATYCSPKSPAPPLKVSVCISHYNHGQYLPQLLEKLTQQTYPNFEVLVRDDRSTEPSSQAVFLSLEKKYPQFTFVRNPKNIGPSATRNANAEMAMGDLLLFMDSDNLPADENMITDFVQGLHYSNADICTSHNLIFKGQNLPQWPEDYIDAYMPLGPCLELGFIENVFGDTNFIIKKNVFRSLGGFRSGSKAIGDWDFLAYAVLQGYILEVIPKPLFHYRHLPQSMLRTTNLIPELRHLLQTYAQYPHALPLEKILEITAITTKSRTPKPALRKFWHFCKGTFKVLTGRKQL